MTIALALAEAERVLAGAGVDDPHLDAELLLRHLLGWDRTRLLLEEHAPLDDARRDRYLALVAERARRRPLQHLTGTQAFWRHQFVVTPDVLVPRPETELLVEKALAFLAGRARPVLVDVGTGTGCIALSLAAERADAVVHAVDLSPAALEVAGENARRLGLAGRVRFHQGDLLGPVAGLRGTVDLVVSNPPYVEADELPGLAPEVRDHEPRLALVPPEGPLPLYRRLAAGARHLLAPGGLLLVEIGATQGEAVAAAFTAAGLTGASVSRDLAGRPRVVEGRR